ncbi:MAG: PAC2 family protein [Sedimentisphaerales bacterium]|nr:PAC2 family protein [Sedimentisphaerales bacterium]
MMAAKKLKIYDRPNFKHPRLLLGFSGWMDGGDVSTGTVKCLIEKLDARKFAEIDPEGFYISSFPGMMEITAMFRPHARIEDGLVVSCEGPRDVFYASEEDDLILFLGREPNLQWEQFGECIFSLCGEFGVKMIYFVGSVSGLVPHTREPRLFCSASSLRLKDAFHHYGVNFSNYEGPASIVTYLTKTSETFGIGMISLVATVPAYVQGNNPKCIEAIARRLTGMLGVQVDLDDLSAFSEEFERRLSDVVQEQPELAGNILKLEEDYDNNIFNNEMGDLKVWLQQQGVRLD